MTKLVITVAVLAIMNTAAHSQTTVDQWIALCSKGASTAEHASCESYARGVADAILVIQATRPQLSTSCIPAGVTAKDLLTLAFPYAQGQPPAARQLVGAALLMDVFREAFPCPRKELAPQKSGLSARGTAASFPEYHWMFSAQTASAQSPRPRP
jgi:hypothetical protein